MFTKLLTTTALITTMGISLPALADTWSERKALVQLKEEVASLRILAIHAESKADSSTRVQFQYEVLLNDLKAIEDGLTAHLGKPFEAQIPSSDSKKRLGKGYTKRDLPEGK